ncbi:hypothetical protein [Paenibacillus foliorum]|uniref:hypothetical protein n=1 Tax=Paenibacillus foliorum TaxID=2654974 RepID=UPI0014916F69|nr:hypothetical protein [Paenibacillus foliorum]
MKPPVVVIKGYRSILRGVIGHMNPDSYTKLNTVRVRFSGGDRNGAAFSLRRADQA